MNTTNHRGISAIYRLGFVFLALAAPALSQVVQPIGTFPRHHHREGTDDQTQTLQTQPQPTPAPAAAPAPSTPPAAGFAQLTPPSLSDKPPQPATVNLAPGRLAIHADNSSLTEILHQLTKDSGMTVDGLGADQRIYGSYGPGDPQEVISSLLDGSGYNIVMLGRTETGTPKQLSLTPRGARPASNGPSNRVQEAPQEDDTEEEVQQPPPPETPPAPQPPQGNPQQNGVRTPQQMLQELQQMRQQQLQQQLQQQQQQQQPQP